VRVPLGDIVDYRLKSAAAMTRGPFKAASEQGRVRVVPNFRQGCVCAHERAASLPPTHARPPEPQRASF
jgi:hypothetical protein